ncbi:MAG: hypothetical protein ACRDYC_00315 [Acidimicrobiales bacterium]
MSIDEELLEERRRRRRAGDPRVSPRDREILMRLVAGDLMGEFQAELDRIAAGGANRADLWFGTQTNVGPVITAGAAGLGLAVQIVERDDRHVDAESPQGPAG